MKRIKYEIRLGEPNRPMSIGPKKVEPILCVVPWQNEGPDLPTKIQILENLLYKDETCSTKRRLALQGEDLLCNEKTCSARMRLALQGKEARPHYYKKPQHPHKKVRVTDSSLAL